MAAAGAGGDEADVDDVVFAEALSADEVEARKRAAAEAAGEVVELLEEVQPESAEAKAKREAAAQRRADEAAVAADARRRAALRSRTDWHTGDGTKQAVEAEVQKAVDDVLKAHALSPALLTAQLRWLSERRSRPQHSYKLNPKTMRHEFTLVPGGLSHAFSVELQPPSAAAPPLSAAQKTAASAALSEISVLPGVFGARSRCACPLPADVASLLTRHGLAGVLSGQLLFPYGKESCVVELWNLPAAKSEAELRALLSPRNLGAPPLLRFFAGRTRAEATYGSPDAATHAAKAFNAKRLDSSAVGDEVIDMDDDGDDDGYGDDEDEIEIQSDDGDKDASEAPVRAKVRTWAPQPHAPRDGGWHAKLVLSAAYNDAGAGGAAASADEVRDAKHGRMARLHGSLERRVASLLWDAEHAHGVAEVDTSALVLVRVEDRVEVARPDWQALRPRPVQPPAAAGTLDLRFRPFAGAAPPNEHLLGAPASPPPPHDAAALRAAALSAAAAGAYVVVAHRRRTVAELRWETYKDIFKLVTEVGRWTAAENKTVSWVTMHAADGAQPLGACVAVGPAFGCRGGPCVWGALHACSAVSGRDDLGPQSPPLVFASLQLTGAAAAGELAVRASISIAVRHAEELPRNRAAAATGDSLALLLRHLSATRPALAPPPPPPAIKAPPPPSAAAGFCGVVGCAAHRASAGAALEAAAADCFSLSRLYEESENPAKDDATPGLAAPAGLTATLQPFQRSTLAWALKREAPPPLLDLHPLIRGVTLTAADGRHAALYWDDGRSTSSAAGDDGRFGTSLPVAPPRDVRGGVIAEEMGMGKTLEVIALMLATKGTKPAVAAATAPDGTYQMTAEDVADAANAVAVALGQRRSGRQRVVTAAAHRITPSRATLVIVPRPLLVQWQAELARHAAKGALRCHVFVRGDQTSPAVLAATNDVVLTTFDVLGAQPGWTDPTPSALLLIHWLRVAVDEAHALSNTTGTSAKFCSLLLAERRWAVTGTPIPARLNDLYGLLAFLRVDPYCNSSAWTQGIVRPIEAQAEHGRDALTALLRRICMRHTKTELSLPPRTLTNVSIALRPAEAAAYASLAARQRRPGFSAQLSKPGVLASYVNALRLASSGLRHRYDDSPVEAAADALRVAALRVGAAPALADAAAATWRREAGLCASCGAATASPAVVPKCAHIMCGACAEGLLEDAAANGRPAASCPACAAPFDEESLLQVPLAATADDDDDGDETAAGAGAKVAHLLAELAKLPAGARALVFSQYKPMLSRVAAALSRAKVRFGRFDGSGSPAVRDAALAEWRSDARVRALLLDTRLAACGLTLTEATRVFILDVPSSVGTLEQAAARAHRLGQTQPVFVQVLVAANTIEARLALRHGRKLGGDGGGALRAADVKALALRQMDWLLSEAPLRDDDDDSDADADAAAAAAAPGDVQAPAHALLAPDAKGPLRAPAAVKLEARDDEDEAGCAGAGADEPAAKRARNGR